MGKKNKRIELWEEIKGLLAEIVMLKTGAKKAFAWEIAEMRKFWLNFFGFSSLGTMNVEELESFRALLQSKIKADYKHKTLPGIIK